MTVILSKNYKPLDLKLIAMCKVSRIVFNCKKTYDIDRIIFYNPIDGIEWIGRYPCYKSGDNLDFSKTWDYYSGKTILKIIKAIEKKEFFGILKISDGVTITVKPK